MPDQCRLQHEERVSCMGILLVDSYSAECVGDVVRSEAALINLCAQSAEQQHKNEWFSGLAFPVVALWVHKCAGLTHDHTSESVLKGFFYSLSRDKRKEFALACKTSVGHLNNCCYGYVPLNPALCVRIERESLKAVTRQDLRADWADIWPELIPTTTKA